MRSMEVKSLVARYRETWEALYQVIMECAFLPVSNTVFLVACGGEIRSVAQPQEVARH